MPLHFTESEKGKKKLVVHGYFVYKDKEREDKIYWKCDKYHKKNKTICGFFIFYLFLKYLFLKNLAHDCTVALVTVYVKHF